MNVIHYCTHVTNSWSSPDFYADGHNCIQVYQLKMFFYSLSNTIKLPNRRPNCSTPKLPSSSSVLILMPLPSGARSTRRPMTWTPISGSPALPIWRVAVARFPRKRSSSFLKLSKMTKARKSIRTSCTCPFQESVSVRNFSVLWLRVHTTIHNLTNLT